MNYVAITTSFLALLFAFMWYYGLMKIKMQKECQHHWVFYRECQKCKIQQRGEPYEQIK